MAEQADVNIKITADASQAQGAIRGVESGTDALTQANERLRGTLDAAKRSASGLDDEVNKPSSKMVQNFANVGILAATASMAIDRMGQALKDAASAGDVMAQAQLEHFGELESVADRLWLSLAKSPLGLGISDFLTDASKMIDELVLMTDAGEMGAKTAEHMGRAMETAAKLTAKSWSEARESIDYTTAAMARAREEGKRADVIVDSQTRIALSKVEGDGPDALAERQRISRAGKDQKERMRRQIEEEDMKLIQANLDQMRGALAVQERLGTEESKKNATKLQAEIARSEGRLQTAPKAERGRRIEFDAVKAAEEAEAAAQLRQAKAAAAAEAAREQERQKQKQEAEATQRQRTLQELRGGLGNVIGNLPNPAAMGGLNPDTAGMDEILKAVQKLVEAMMHNKTVTNDMRRQIQTLSRQAEQAKLADAAGG